MNFRGEGFENNPDAISVIQLGDKQTLYFTYVLQHADHHLQIADMKGR